jgi:crossover junction endodeoxyribonuclease RuvC
MNHYMGIDPGYSGAISVIDERGNLLDTIKLKETEHDVADFVRKWDHLLMFALLEKVSAMPRQGVSSTFKFGTSYGFCRALLVCYKIPFETVTPAKWQQAMGCRSKGDKNVTKSAAQRLFPRIKVTHATADALLIGEHARLISLERSRTCA